MYFIAIPSIYCFHASFADIRCLKDRTGNDDYFKAQQVASGIMGLLVSFHVFWHLLDQSFSFVESNYLVSEYLIKSNRTTCN